MDEIDAILDWLLRHRDALLAGDTSALRHTLFAAHESHRSPGGSTVIKVTLSEAARDRVPETHRFLDLFVLEPRSRIGAHRHRHSSAHVHMLGGTGRAEIDGVFHAFAPGSTFVFPRGARHDVLSDDAPVLFVSFQDHPIILPDGSLDYIADD